MQVFGRFRAMATSRVEGGSFRPFMLLRRLCRGDYIKCEMNSAVPSLHVRRRVQLIFAPSYWQKERMLLPLWPNMLVRSRLHFCSHGSRVCKGIRMVKVKGEYSRRPKSANLREWIKRFHRVIIDWIPCYATTVAGDGAYCHGGFPVTIVLRKYGCWIFSL